VTGLGLFPRRPTARHAHRRGTRTYIHAHPCHTGGSSRFASAGRARTDGGPKVQLVLVLVYWIVVLVLVGSTPLLMTKLMMVVIALIITPIDPDKHMPI
jgi:hypothetical protein